MKQTILYKLYNNFLHKKILSQYKLEILLLVLYTLLLVTISFFITSCKNSKKEAIYQNVKVNSISRDSIEKGEKLIQPKSVIAQTYDVLIVNPSQKQLDSLQDTMEDDEFTTFVDESTFYINQAKKYSETIHSQVIEVESGTSVFFESENGKKFTVATNNLLWDIIVFDGNSKPELIDITNVQEEMIRVYDKAKK